LSTGFDKTLQKHPDLAQVIEAWPDLPEHVKSKIMELAISLPPKKGSEQ